MIGYFKVGNSRQVLSAPGRMSIAEKSVKQGVRTLPQGNQWSNGSKGGDEGFSEVSGAKDKLDNEFETF